MITENETCALFEFDNEKISTRMPDKLDVKLPKRYFTRIKNKI